MKITKKQTLKILKYLEEHEDFYFPFRILCNDIEKNDFYYDIDCNEINYEEIENNPLWLNFTLEENLQTLYEDTTELMAKGFLDKINNKDILEKISKEILNLNKKWKMELCESENIEEYGLNEFIGGKKEAYEECKKIIEKNLYI